MTIQEAIKSGKPFRRPSWDWLEVSGDKFQFVEPSRQREPRFISSDFLATDWEIKQEPIVFECSWENCSVNIDPQKGFWSPVPFGLNLPEIPINKRTRVTIELLD